jgi:hypothetical protein
MLAANEDRQVGCRQYAPCLRTIECELPVAEASECVFRLMVDRISRPTWTLIPAQRGQNSGLIVDSFRGEPQ